MSEGKLGAWVNYQSEELLYLFIVGFFLLAALDMIRRLLDARFSYEQIKPKSVFARWIMVLSASLVLGVGYDLVMTEVKKNINPEALASVKKVVSDSTANGAIGGLGWIDPNTLLIVRDSKNKAKYKFSDAASADLAKLPLAFASVSGSDVEIESIRLSAISDLKDALLPSDLEAVCIPVAPKKMGKHSKTKTESVRVIAVESRKYGAVPGRLFLIDLKSTHVLKGKKREIEWQATVVGIENLPDDPNPQDPDKGLHQVEGLACFEDATGTYTVALGYRGSHALGSDASRDRDGGILLVPGVDFLSPTVLPRFDPTKLMRPDSDAHKPDCIEKDNLTSGEWRDVSDLHIDDGGLIWSASTIDVRDDGPFCSSIYRFNHRINYNEVSGNWVLIKDDHLEKPVPVREHKVEAIIGKEPGNRNFFLGYDNEDIGSGIITP